MAPSPAYTLAFVSEGKGGLILRVRAVPGSRKDRILGPHGDALRVAVSAPPERGKANRALVEVIARDLGLRASSIALIGGETSRDKSFLIVGLAREELARRFSEILGPHTGAEATSTRANGPREPAPTTNREKREER